MVSRKQTHYKEHLILPDPASLTSNTWPLMSETESFEQLMQSLVAGDHSAAETIVREYTSALVHVARREIGAKLGRRIDAEDVVQSAYRSFFLRMEQGEYDLGSGSELWKLLLTIMLNKVRRQGNFHLAQKRSIAKELSAHERQVDAANRVESREPPPEAAVMLIDELHSFLQTLVPEDRRVVELRLQGFSTVEIARETERAERTVRRVLEQIRKRLQQPPD
jgi:RNA polymerase sigma-70 factor (ECF subfamily)